MNWNDLSAFLAVHRTGTYAAAGRDLGVNSTTIARRIDRLGHDIGAVLFQVSADGLVPTPAAETILPAAIAMERQATLIIRKMSGDEARLSGKVRVATTPEFLTHFLLQHLAAFHEAHPRLELDFFIGNTLASLSSGDADIAVRFASLERGMPLAAGESPDSVVGRVLGPVHVDLVASRDYLDRRGPPGDDFAGHDFILQPDKNYLPGMEYLAQFADTANVAVRCDSLNSLMEAAAQGLGITAMPTYFASRYPNLITVRRDIAVRTGWLLMARDLRRVARVRAVRDFIVELWLLWGGVWAGDESAVPAPA